MNKKEFLSETVKIRNALQEEIFTSVVSKSVSNTYWERRKARINKLYDKYENSWSKYLEYIHTLYEDERWKQIRIAKKERPSLNMIPAEKEVSIEENRSFFEDSIDDMNFTINNSKKPYMLLMRLLQLDNKQKKQTVEAFFEMHAFLEEEEIQEIISEAESFPDARNKLIDELTKQAANNKFITLITKTGKIRNWDIKKYSTMLTRTVTREIQTKGVLDAANFVGTDLVQVSSHNTVCPICIEYEGKIYSISGTSPIFPPLINAPPYHPYPYDKETKILTKNRGWIYVKDINVDDECMSLNKETNKIEYSKVTKLYKSFQKEMIKFKSRTVDMLVSKDHRMLVTGNDRKINRLVPANTLLDKKSGFFLGGGKWNSEIDISNDWAEFLGYYLSDGNACKNKGNYIITISKLKTNKHYIDIVNCIKKIHNGSIFELLDRINFNSKNIYNKLHKIGISYNKYIPNSIRNASIETIKIFLTAFIKCDGYIRYKKLSNYDNGNIYEERVYYTSSEKMMADLCECIIKIGKKPSFSIIHKKGSKAKFGNKISIRNANVYQIRELSHTYNSIKSTKKEIKQYNDCAYCVELEKNHVLYVSRNGKCMWSGNCLHSLTSVFEEALYRDGIDKYVDFSQGRSDMHPTVRDWIPISERKIRAA